MKGIFLVVFEYDRALNREMPWGLLAWAFCVILVWIVRARGGNRRFEFDERQIAEQRIAFRRAWLSGAAYETAYAVSCAIGFRFADDAAGPLLGVLLSFAVFLFTAAARDALLPFRDKENTVVSWLSLTFVGVMWMGLFFLHAHRRGDFSRGLITVGMIELLCGLLAASFGAVQLIRLLRKRGGGDRDGDGA